VRRKVPALMAITDIVIDFRQRRFDQDQMPDAE